MTKQRRDQHIADAILCLAIALGTCVVIWPMLLNKTKTAHMAMWEFVCFAITAFQVSVTMLYFFIWNVRKLLTQSVSSD